MKSKKEIAALKLGTPKLDDIIRYVVSHGDWRIKRGKNLSATLPAPYMICNPLKAYRTAKELLSNNKVNKARMALRRQMLHTGQTPLEAILGVRPPNESPWPGARKVPHTTNWY